MKEEEREDLEVGLLDIVAEASDLARGAHFNSKSWVSATKTSERKHRHLHRHIVIVCVQGRSEEEQSVRETV
jgi:hypothetical protein